MTVRKLASLFILAWIFFIFSCRGGEESSLNDSEEKPRSEPLRHSVSKKTQHVAVSSVERCPQMMEISPCQHWDTINNETWRWHNKPCDEKGPDTSRIIEVSRKEPDRRSIKHITKNKTSIVFYGSSHVRELYASLIRLERGVPFDEILESNVTRVPSAQPSNQAKCDPYKEGWGNLEGINMEVCGKPGKRLVPELADRVAIGFHTFVHTPDADQIFVDWLEEVSLRQPDFLVVDVGVWGPRGTRVGGSAATVWTIPQELDFYLSWLQSAFPTSILVFVMDTSTAGGLTFSMVEQRIQGLVATSSGRAVMLRKDLIMRSKPKTMPCEHGCSGPVLTVLAHLMMDWLEEAHARKGCCQAF